MLANWSTSQSMMIVQHISTLTFTYQWPLPKCSEWKLSHLSCWKISRSCCLPVDEAKRRRPYLSIGDESDSLFCSTCKFYESLYLIFDLDKLCKACQVSNTGAEGKITSVAATQCDSASQPEYLFIQTMRHHNSIIFLCLTVFSPQGLQVRGLRIIQAL